MWSDAVGNKRNNGAKKIGEKAVFKTRRFTVFDSKLKIRGKILNKPYIRQNSCSEILAITEDGFIILVKSYRPELDCYVYELPAGTLKNREDPEKAAMRELEEETGYAPRKIEYMFGGYPLLGYSDCKLYFFLATGLEKKKQNLEEDESINVKLFKPAEVLRLLEKGKIKDLCVLPAMYHYYYVMKEGKKRVRYMDPH